MAGGGPCSWAVPSQVIGSLRNTMNTAGMCFSQNLILEKVALLRKLVFMEACGGMVSRPFHLEGLYGQRGHEVLT